MTKKLESKIERNFRKRIQALGCIVVKFEDPAHRGAPDRLILCPNGRAVFIEFKKPGCEPSGHQIRYLETLRGMGYLVGWADNEAAALRWVRKITGL